MTQETVAALDDLIYQRILAMEGFEALRGENYANNIGRAVIRGNETSIDVQLPNNLSYRKVYDSVCRLLQEGRIVQVNTVRSLEVYGSIGCTSPVNQRCSVFRPVL